MSTNIVFDNHYNVAVASSGGWMDFTDWISSLPVHEFPNLCHLIKYGWTGNLRSLATEIDHALRNYPPRKIGVRSTTQGILQQIKSQEHKAQLVMVGGGIVPPR
jgi:hypothetical protein